MSNLLEKASILLTPTAYDDGKILSVKPEDGTGDFTFTRNSSATRVTSQGLIEDMQILSGDLVTNGDFSNGANNWSLGAGWSIGVGKVIGSSASGTLSQAGIASAGKQYKVTFSVTDYSSGTLFVDIGGSSAQTTTSNGLKTFYFTSTSTGSLRFYGGSFTGSIDNVSVIEITDDTDLPRIDYSPYSGAGSCGHWLFEPQSTNLIITSDSGVYGNNPASEILTTAPDGTNTAVRPVPDSNSDRYTGQISGGTYATNTKITYSWYRKRISTPVIDIYVGDLQPNVLVNVTQVGSTIQVESDINGFDRFSATFNITDGSLASNIRLYFGAIIGTGNSSVAYWGHQLEVGSFATSLIPTNGSTVTRLKDAAFGAGNSSLINSTEGVLYAEVAALAEQTLTRYITLSDGTSSNRIIIYITDVGVIKFFVGVGGVTQAAKTVTGQTTTNFNKLAVSYKENDMKFYLNGVKVHTDTSASTYPTDTLSVINFAASNGTSSPFFGKANCLAVFEEALTDAELTCLTTI